MFADFFFSFLQQFDKYTPKLDNPFIRHSNVSSFSDSRVNMRFAFWQIKYLAYLNVACEGVYCGLGFMPAHASVLYDLMFFFTYLCFPSSSVLLSSSPPTPQPCQACPRCSRTQDPSARCREPSSLRSEPYPHLRAANRLRKEGSMCTKTHTSKIRNF